MRQAKNWNFLNYKRRNYLYLYYFNAPPEIHTKINDTLEKYGHSNGMVRFWLGPFVPMIALTDAKLAKVCVGLFTKK